MEKQMSDRETLQSALTAQCSELAALRAEYGSLPNLSHIRYAVGAEPESERRRGELLQLIGGAEGKIESLQSKLHQAERFESFIQAAKCADDEASKAKDALVAAAADAARLLQRRSQVSAKVDHLRSTAAAQLELARAREQSASTAYARAVSAGSEAEQAAAHAEVAAAQAEVADASRAADAQKVVVAALEAEIEALDRDLVAVGDQAEEARQDLCAALRRKYEAEWDRAVDVLEQIGARYAETYRLRGSSVPPIAHSAIPRFQPARPSVQLDRLGEADLPEVDKRTRDGLAVLFAPGGNRITALRRKG